jgi:hypothetical protein
MRLDLWLWAAGGILVLIAGVLRLTLRAKTDPASTARWGLLAPLLLACVGLASLVAGLAWRVTAKAFPPWRPDAWPGSTPADGVVLLAVGTLAILSWLLLSDLRRIRAMRFRDPGMAEDGGGDRGRAIAEALALFGSCLLVLPAIGAAWRSPLPEPFPQAQSWLFAARVITASLGLGAWLPAFADAVWGLRLGLGRPGPESTGATLGWQAMRTGYPWLTLAWLLGAVWSLAAVAALWRGVSTDAWLTIAWLLGGICLIAGRVDRPAILPQWALVLLTVCGMAAALLQAWQAPRLLF